MNAPSLLAAAPACCEDELWECLPGWPHHEASTCGRVRVVDWVDERGLLHLGRILPLHPDKRRGKGYLYFDLRDGGRRQRMAVAAAVLEAHRGARPGEDYEACHGPAGRADNHLTNLRWDTKAANLAEMWEARRAVTDGGADLSQDKHVCHKSQVRWGVWPLAVLSQPSVTGDRSQGTGRSRPLPHFLSSSTSLNPPNLTLRTLLRSVRNRLAA